MRRACIIALAVCLSLSCRPAVAAGDETELASRVSLTAQATTFSVTVPAVLPVALAADGSVVCATDAKIVNHSGAPVVVSSIEINGLDGWDVLDYDSFSAARGAKAISMRINGVGVADGVIATDGEGFPPIAAENELTLEYEAKVAPQAVAITTATGVAEVIFTVCWDTAG